jgi:hypothetical protein
MARKLNPSKLQRQNNGANEAPQPANRRASPPVAALYLMQLRAQGLKISPSPRRTRVAIEAEENAENEQPVKITNKINKID